MNELIPMKLPNTEEKNAYRLGTGVVSEVSAELYTVVDVHPRSARRAASCLVLPQVGDTVLLARSNDAYWIVAVLVASGERDLKLQAPRLSADAIQMNLTAQEMRTTSPEWQAIHGNVHLMAQRLSGQVGMLDWLSDRVTACLDMFVGRFRTSLREVRDIESTKCGNYDLHVDQTMVMSSKNGVIAAQGLMKVDASQIHIG
jgi:hypothetical protein